MSVDRGKQCTGALSTPCIKETCVQHKSMNRQNVACSPLLQADQVRPLSPCILLPSLARPGLGGGAAAAPGVHMACLARQHVCLRAAEGGQHNGPAHLEDWRWKTGQVGGDFSKRFGGYEGLVAKCTAIDQLMVFARSQASGSPMISRLLARISCVECV